MSTQELNIRPDFDREIVDIVDYVMNYEITSKVAYDTAHYCLLDTLGCGLEALEYPACKKLLGPIVPGTVVPNGARVPGTQLRNAVAAGKAPLTMKQVLSGMIKAHEIQGCIALENAFNRVGLDHVLLVKVASTAVVAEMLARYVWR